jgi:RHS repeat-associated protein
MRSRHCIVGVLCVGMVGFADPGPLGAVGAPKPPEFQPPSLMSVQSDANARATSEIALASNNPGPAYSDTRQNTSPTPGQVDLSKLPALPKAPGFAAKTQPMEVPAKRTEFSRTFINPDGSSTVEVSAERINYRSPSGSFEPIATSLRAGPATGTFETFANDWKVTFAPLDAGGVELVASDGARFRFAPESLPAVAPTLAADSKSVTYVDAWPGVDLRYRIGASGVEETILIKRKGVGSEFAFATEGVVLEDAGPRGLRSSRGGAAAPFSIGRVAVLNGKGVPADIGEESNRPDLPVQRPANTARNTSGALLRANPAMRVEPGATSPNGRSAAPGVAGGADRQRLVVGVASEWVAAQPEDAFPLQIDPTVSVGPANGIQRTSTISANDCLGTPTACTAWTGTSFGIYRTYVSLNMWPVWSSMPVGSRQVTDARLELQALGSQPSTSELSAYYAMPQVQTPIGPLYEFGSVSNGLSTLAGSGTIPWPSGFGTIGVTAPIQQLAQLADGATPANSWWDVGLVGKENVANSFMQFPSYAGQLTSIRLRVTFANRAPVVSGTTPALNPLGITAVDRVNLSITGASSDPDGDALQSLHEVCEIVPGSPVSCDNNATYRNTGWNANYDTVSVPNLLPLKWGHIYAYRYSSSDGLNVGSTGWMLFTPKSPELQNPKWNAGSDPYSGFHGGVNLATGNFTKSEVDAAVSAVGPPLAVTRTYNSLDTRVGLFGKGWSSELDQQIEVDGAGNVTLTRLDGQRFWYGRNTDGTLESPLGAAETMVIAGSNYELRSPDNSKLVFSGSTGRLLTNANGYGQALNVTWSGSVPTQIRSSVSGRSIFFTTSGGLITSVKTDPVGSQGQLMWSYGYSGTNLISVNDPINPAPSTVRTNYVYAGVNGQLSDWKRPLGNSGKRLTYFSDGRVQSAADGLNASTTYTYSATSPVAGESFEVTVRDPRLSTTKWGFDSLKRLVRRTNEIGKSRTWAYDTNGYLTEVVYEESTSSLVRKDTFVNDGNGNPTVSTDRWGRSTYRTYDAKGNVTVERDARSTSATDDRYRTNYRYSAEGLLTDIDPVSTLKGDTAFTYSCQNGAAPPVNTPCGLLLEKREPISGTYPAIASASTRSTYNAKGDLVSVVDTRSATTASTHDELGRVVSQTKTGTAIPAGTTHTIQYDKMSRPVVVTGPVVAAVGTPATRQARTTTVYDANGNVTSTTVADVNNADPPRQTTTAYDAADRPVTVTETPGTAIAAVTTSVYDGNGNVTAVIDPLGRRTEQTFDVRNLPTRTTLKAYVADPKNAPTVAADLVIQSRTYDDAGRVISSTDALGRTTEFTYQADQVARTTLKNYTPYSGAAYDLVISEDTYDNVNNRVKRAEGNIVSGSARARTTTFTYDAMSQPVRQDLFLGAATTPERTTLTTFDGAGHIVKIQQAANASGVLSRETRYQYNSKGLLDFVEVENGAGATDDLRTSYTYDAAGNTLTVTDPGGGVSSATFNQLGKIVTNTAPTVAVESNGGTPTSVAPVSRTAYNVFGEVVQITDPNGNVTKHAYDQRGRETLTTYPTYTPPGGTAITPTEVRIFDAIGNIAQVTDRRGKVSKAWYDQLNRPWKTQAPGSAPGTFAEAFTAYDRVGNIVSTTDALGAVTTFTYYATNLTRSRTSVIRQPSSRSVTSYVDYDTLGQPITSVNEVGAITSQTFNAAGDVLSTKDPLNHTTTMQYNAFGDLVRVTDATNIVRTFSYDQAGRNITASELGQGGTQTPLTTTFTYDRRGLETAVTSPEGRKTTKAYDAAARLTSVTQGSGTPQAATTAAFYDRNGNVTRVRDGRGNNTVSTYQPWNLQESVIEPPTVAGQAATARTFTTTYDAAGLPVKESQPGGVSLSRVFDEAGRVLTETGVGASGSRQVAYDLLGRITQISHPVSPIAVTYDDRSMPLTIAGGNSTASYSYDNAGRVVSRSDATGLATATYDAASRLTKLTDPVSGGSLEYGYDNANRLTAVNRNASGANWSPMFARPRSSRSYDVYGRLASMFEYANPSVGTFGAVDIPRIYGKQFSYDKDGLIKQELVDGSVSPADRGTHQYSYTALGQLASWTAPSGAVSNYSYDLSGNRVMSAGVASTFDARNRPTKVGGTSLVWSDRGTLVSETTGGVTTASSFDVFGEAILSGSVSTVYDGLGRVATRDGVAFGYSGLGQDVINDGTTVFGRSLSGVPVSSKTAVSGSLRWLVGDQHGDVVGMVMPATGVMSSTVGFDPWGVVTGRSGVGLSVAGFQGDWTDPVSGVVDMEARGYSPLLGTFTSRDSVSGSVSSPLSMNRFGYGEGDPVNHSDPSGHSIASILAAATVAVSAGASAVVGATPQGQAQDFYYTVAAQQSLDVFNNIPRPGAPDVNGSEDAYRAAVDANRLYRMLQMDVWFRLVAVGKGDPSAYGSNQKDREQAIADNDKAYVFLAAVAWAQAHPAPVALPIGPPAPPVKSPTAPNASPASVPMVLTARLKQAPDGYPVASGPNSWVVEFAYRFVTTMAEAMELLMFSADACLFSNVDIAAGLQGITSQKEAADMCSAILEANRQLRTGGPDWKDFVAFGLGALAGVACGSVTGPAGAPGGPAGVGVAAGAGGAFCGGYVTRGVSTYLGGGDATEIIFAAGNPSAMLEDALLGGVVGGGIAVIGNFSALMRAEAGLTSRYLQATTDLPVDIPKGWVPRIADNGKGVVFQRPGAIGNADMIRVMDPIPRYPNGYVVIHNSSGQPVDLAGRTGRDVAHIPR